MHNITRFDIHVMLPYPDDRYIEGFFQKIPSLQTQFDAPWQLMERRAAFHRVRLYQYST